MTMVVFDVGDSWQMVEQVDHAALSGQLAAAWGRGRFEAAHPALVIAAARHDEGWAVWDRHPLLNDDSTPMTFLQAPPPALLSSYEACVDAMCNEDDHAGLLVSRHVSGLRRGRYGLAPDSRSREAWHADDREDPRITDFVAAQHRRQDMLRERLAIDPEQELHQYAQLQLFDVLSLRLCLADLSRAGASFELDMTPTAPGAPEAVLRARALGENRVEVDPWPFGAPTVEVSLRRRLLAPGCFADTRALRAAWAQAKPQALAIALASAAG